MGARLRVFLLAGVPFIPRSEQRAWIERSVRFAFECGASVVTIIPTRGGNGALEALGPAIFTAPTLEEFEQAFDAALAQARGRVFADLWDLQRLVRCEACVERRRERLQAINLEQRSRPQVSCTECASHQTAV
jgi:hypothetical protein